MVSQTSQQTEPHYGMLPESKMKTELRKLAAQAKRAGQDPFSLATSIVRDALSGMELFPDECAAFAVLTQGQGRRKRAMLRDMLSLTRAT